MKKEKSTWTICKVTLSRGLWIAIFLIPFLWLSTLLLLFMDSTKAGTFGDMFGAVNALFSGFAFLGIIYTISLQRRELKLQRKELKLTRKEFKTQNRTLSFQRFENTLFQMLQLHHEIIDKLEIKTTEIDINHPSERVDEFKKRWVFKESKTKILKALLYMRERGYDETESTGLITKIRILEGDEEYRDWIVDSYLYFYKRDEGSNLSYYFRNLYHIFKFIHLSTDIEPERKRFYASLVRAQLSPDELFLVFYNAFVPGLGHPNMLFLIKEYDILQNLDDNEINTKYSNHLEVFERMQNQCENPFNEKLLM
ncbi:hypothetical protein G5B10_07715 [Fluviicola sp. SGL-29]|nr:hypothetical protein [Fluviicola sp. SGL-29]